jgi:hypothetical protein
MAPARVIGSVMFGCGGGFRADLLGADLRQAEVEKLRAVLGDDDITRLEVAVDHAFGMRGRQCVRDLHGIAQGFVERQRTTLDDLRERFAFNQFQTR